MSAMRSDLSREKPEEQEFLKKESASSEKIREVVHEQLGLEMVDIYKIVASKEVCWGAPKFDKALKILGGIGIQGKVERYKWDEEERGLRDSGYWRRLLERLETDNLGDPDIEEAKYDDLRVEGQAQEQARKIWFRYVDQVAKEVHGISSVLRPMPLTKEHLFPVEK